MNTAQHTPLTGKGYTSLMEVRELGGNGRYAIMHTSNDAIICYGDGTKEDAERILTLLTSAPDLLKENEELKQRLQDENKCARQVTDIANEALKEIGELKSLNSELLESLRGVAASKSIMMKLAPSANESKEILATFERVREAIVKAERKDLGVS